MSGGGGCKQLVNSLVQLQAMGLRALLRFSSDMQHLESAVIIFSRKCHVEKDGCMRCLSKQNVAHLRLPRD